MKVRIQVSKEYQVYEVEATLNPDQDLILQQAALRKFANTQLDLLVAEQKNGYGTQKPAPAPKAKANEPAWRSGPVSAGYVKLLKDAKFKVPATAGEAFDLIKEHGLK